MNELLKAFFDNFVGGQVQFYVGDDPIKHVRRAEVNGFHLGESGLGVKFTWVARRTDDGAWTDVYHKDSLVIIPCFKASEGCFSIQSNWEANNPYSLPYTFFPKGDARLIEKPKG